VLNHLAAMGNLRLDDLRTPRAANATKNVAFGHPRQANERTEVSTVDLVNHGLVDLYHDHARHGEAFSLRLEGAFGRSGYCFACEQNASRLKTGASVLVQTEPIGLLKLCPRASPAHKFLVWL
jgi:hypothetical protein